MRQRCGWALAFVAVMALAGCLAPTEPAADASPRATVWPPAEGAVAGIGAPDQTCAGWPCQLRDPKLPGMAIDARFEEGDGWHRLDLTAFNDGDRLYWLNSACVFQPWAEILIDKDGGQLHAREPPPPDDHPDGCLECDVVEFSPGGFLRHSAEFRDSFWHPDGYDVPARSGTYTWSLGISLHTDPGCKGYGGSLGVAVLVVVP